LAHITIGLGLCRAIFIVALVRRLSQNVDQAQSLTMLMLQDQTIIATAIPKITGQFKAMEATVPNRRPRTSVGTVAHAVDATIQQFGKIDVLVASVGIAE
jgi:NAD(P)-dependent dehydrogenase (short-subunit alcohol dehydrogenase family)